MTECNKFKECQDCVNLEFDPFQCDTCEQACNFEPYDEDDEDDFEDMSITEFADYWRDSE